MLVENSLIAKRLQIELEALQFDAQSIGDIPKRQASEVRLSRLRADRRKLRTDDLDLIVTIGKLIFERLQQAPIRA